MFNFLAILLHYKDDFLLRHQSVYPESIIHILTVSFEETEETRIIWISYIS